MPASWDVKILVCEINNALDGSENHLQLPYVDHPFCNKDSSTIALAMQLVVMKLINCSIIHSPLGKWPMCDFLMTDEEYVSRLCQSRVISESGAQRLLPS